MGKISKNSLRRLYSALLYEGFNVRYDKGDNIIYACVDKGDFRVVKGIAEEKGLGDMVKFKIF